MLFGPKPAGKNFTVINTECDTIPDIREIFHHKHYNLVIERTTKIIEDLQQRPVMTTMLHQKIAHTLELRMTAWEALSHYMNALKDAREVIKYAPHDPKGYLWSSQFYARFDKYEQGHEILKKGLKQVTLSSRNEHYYQKLEEAIKILEKQHHEHRHKKDILISLPYELSCRILDKLTQSSLVQCSNVNSSWRTLVSNYPKIWRCMKISAVEVNDMYFSFYKLLPFITHHIQELELHDRKGFKKCLDLIRRNNFGNLCTFRINLCKNI